MEWREDGILLVVRPHGESSAIIETLTHGHGRHAGLVQGGKGSKLSPMLQPGAQLSLEWRARLAEHLGHFKVEPVRSRAAAIMSDRVALAGLNAMGALLVTLLPEREPNPTVYDATIALADAMAQAEWDWPARYARWEVALLTALGFGLDLGRCGATGSTEDLVYVSPRTGRAISSDAGGVWADKLLPLPAFLIGDVEPTVGDVRDALRMSGYFLEHWACPTFERQALPESRNRLVRLLESHSMRDPSVGV